MRPNSPRFRFRTAARGSPASPATGTGIGRPPAARRRAGSWPAPRPVTGARRAPAEIPIERVADPLERRDLIEARAAARASPTARSAASASARSDAVVDPVDVPPAIDRQDVAALAIGVVHDRVEDRHPAQPRVVVDDHRHDVDLGIGIDERLDHALAERPVAQDRRRDDAPAGRLRDVPGGDLAARQRAVREVVERPLAERSACRSRRARAAVRDRDSRGSPSRASRCSTTRRSGPTISISPSRSASSVVPRSITDRRPTS